MAIKGWSLGALIAALKSAAYLDVGTTSNTVAAGDDSRITGAAQKALNLSDLVDKSVAWTNLGGKGAGKLDVGAIAGTVAAGDDSRIVGASQKSQNLNDLSDLAQAWINLGGGNAGKATLVTSATDATSGRVLTVGYRGIGATLGIVDGGGIDNQGSSLVNGWSWSEGDGYSVLGYSAQICTLNMNRGGRPCRLHMIYDTKRSYLSYYSGSVWTYREIAQIDDGNLTIPGRISSDALSSSNAITVGTATFSTTGDCRGSTWGNGWLSAYLINQFNTKADKTGTVIGARLGTRSVLTVTQAESTKESPAGNVLTGGGYFSANGLGYYFYRPFQVNINGTWATISSTS